MYGKLKNLLLPCTPLLVVFLCSCAHLPVPAPDDRLTAYRVTDDDTLLTRFAPVFVIENNHENYNRIGTPEAQIGMDGKEVISVDPGQGTVYTRVDKFETSKASYTNLIYRIHFEEVPGGFFPFHLGKGKNVGLIVVVTLDSENRPLLYTSVHTCGCYLAFVPTSYLPADLFPDTWNKKRQSVYSETLPGMLAYGGFVPEQTKTVLLIRDATHRVGNMWLSDSPSLHAYRKIGMALRPFDSLERLPLKNHGTTPFYETSGSRKGYVKGSHKGRERLFMSWWAFDWRVGEDKKLGKDENDGTLFYTSLKPWSRKKSDMRNFVDFLRYWGWKF